MREKVKKYGVWSRLFRGHSWVHVIFMIAVVITCYTLAVNFYYFWKIKQQEAVLVQERDELRQEQDEMKQKISDLKDPVYIEKKAREDLGLVKDGEIPYVK